jgi:hypothetical protein
MFRYKAGADPGIFQRGSSMPLNLAFEGGGSTIGFQRGRVYYWFQKGSPLSKCIYLHYPCSNGEKVGWFRPLDYTLLLLDNVLKIMNTELIMILVLRFIFVNLVIFVYTKCLRVCIVLYLLYFSAFKLRFYVLHCSRCVIEICLCKNIHCTLFERYY